MWILAGSNDARILNYWNPKLPQYAGNNNSYHGAYGFRIRNSFGLDQLERAYFALKNNPETRQVVISIWDPKLDFPSINGDPVDKDIPCNICSLLKIRDEKLEWTQIMRSNDVFLGLPYNFIQFTTLQEILAGWLNVEVGSYTHFSDSLHLYENNFDVLTFSNNIEIRNPDILSISKTKFDSNLNKIFGNMISIAQYNLSENELLNLAELDTGDKAYQNIMLIISAYAAYKLSYLETEKEILSHCSNELFVHMWKQWKVSKEGGKSR
jgi:thymidylate synthase